VTIPVGFRATAGNGLTYVVTAAATVPKGDYVTVQCETAGVAGDLDEGEQLTWDSAALGWLAQTCTVAPGGIAGGKAAESNEELRRRFALPMVQAQKTGKRGFIELMNSDLIAGNLRVLGSGCGEWVSEAITCQWNQDRTAEDPQYSNHRLDAALYAWRECHAWAEREAVPAAASDGPDRQQEREKRAALEAAARRDRRRRGFVRVA
jgi:hypothetical protein